MSNERNRVVRALCAEENAPSVRTLWQGQSPEDLGRVSMNQDDVGDRTPVYDARYVKEPPGRALLRTVVGVFVIAAAVLCAVVAFALSGFP